jgi:uncharacterized membrane protein YccF (DUF307 family)
MAELRGTEPPKVTDGETEPAEPHSLRERAGGAASRGKHWGGYAWFMSFGTFLPLLVFLGSYLVHLTLVGGGVAKRIDRAGIWMSTLGQEPPGKEKLEARKSDDKKPFFERIRPYTPPGLLERRGRPVSMPVRVLWFVFVGWWLGILWVLLSWSVFLLPYPFLDAVAQLLGELPTVMTLAYPQTKPAGA